MRQNKYRGWDGEKMLPAQDLSQNGACWEWLGKQDVELIQYTGLNVFDAVEVYEGDKLEFTVFDCMGGDTQHEGYVVYDGSRFMLWNKPDDEFYGSDGGFDLDWVLSQDDEAKIIGNKFQNPELLKPTKDGE